MKNIKNIITSIAFGTLLASCSLESKVYNDINEGIFPKNEKDAEALITGAAYGPFRSNYYEGIFSVAVGGIQTISEMSTDIGECQWNDAAWPDVLYQNYRPNSIGVIRFYDYRRDITRMTKTFNRIKDVPMNEEVRSLFNAELHMGRGWLSYLLYDLYGPVPIAMPEDLVNPLDDKSIPRPTKEAMVNFIKDELLKAIEVLPAKYDAGSTKYGRFTKGLAYTVLLKLYMHEENWAEAIKVGRELMKPEYGYQLVPEYKDIFTLENEKNSEIIFAAQCSRATNKQLWLAHVLSSVYPTKNPNIQKWGGYRVPWNFYNTFQKEDKRLEVLVGEFTGTDGKLYNEENPGTVLQKGALPIKYGEDPAAIGEESQIDWVVYRYADVLTLLSEALVREANSVTQEAVDLLNLIRERAGLTLYSTTDFANVEQFLDAILMERGHELWFEGHRRSDLIRHGKYIEYARKYKGSTTTKDEFVLMPIPQWAIDEGKGVVTQNPGY